MKATFLEFGGLTVGLMSRRCYHGCYTDQGAVSYEDNIGAEGTGVDNIGAEGTGVAARITGAESCKSKS